MTILMTAKEFKKNNQEKLESAFRKKVSEGVIPSVHVILVGENPASVIYTRNKKKFIEGLGGQCEIIKLSEGITEPELIKQIELISNDPKIHGCFVQMPLPQHLAHLDVGQMIPPEKDIDGFHAENLYRVMLGKFDGNELTPCTPKGVVKLLKSYAIEMKGKDVIIIGRSMIVGKPLSLLLTAEHATVTLAHSKTVHLEEKTQKADIIIAAIGKAGFIERKHLDPNRKDQVVIDVGINKNSEGKICGDVKTKEMIDYCHAITPVPGGVGPMTIYCLAENLLVAASQQNKG